jgi:hypothetical protein
MWKLLLTSTEFCEMRCCDVGVGVKPLWNCLCAVLRSVLSLINIVQTKLSTCFLWKSQNLNRPNKQNKTKQNKTNWLYLSSNKQTNKQTIVFTSKQTNKQTLKITSIYTCLSISSLTDIFCLQICSDPEAAEYSQFVCFIELRVM